ncbi:MAG TPA: c-type cytochrome domain-containing protein [Bacteroidota bacterium]|nr:c-type cytochrome domain-containing protein [Bacteroidota bacterium]
MDIARYLRVPFSFCLLVFSLSACKDSTTDNTQQNIVFPPSHVSYGKQVEPLFLAACAIPGCHTEESAPDAGGLSLETYQDALSVPLVIIPKDTLDSRLVWSIQGEHGATIMPPIGRPPLSANQITGLKTWIKEGALNN